MQQPERDLESETEWLLTQMRIATPAFLVNAKDGGRPWRTGEHLRLIRATLADGVDVHEAARVVRGAARLVELGRQDAVFWRVRNLFHTPGLDWWHSQVSAFEAEQARARAREERRAQAEQVYEAETLAMVVGGDCGGNVVPIQNAALARHVVQWYEATGRPPPNPKQLGLPIDE